MLEELSKDDVDQALLRMSTSFVAQLKFLVQLFPVNEVRSSVRKYAYERMFDLFEKRFLNIPELSEKKAALTEVLAYVEKNFGTNSQEYTATITFLGKITGGIGLLGTSSGDVASRITDELQREKMYVTLKRGLSLTELEMIVSFGYFVTAYNYGTFAGVENEKAYQTSQLVRARADGREIIVVINVPRWLVDYGVPPYGDWSVAHFNDQNEVVPADYAEDLESLREEAKKYVSEHELRYKERREAFIRQFEASNKKMPRTRDWDTFYQERENVLFVNAYRAQEKIPRVLKRIEAWNGGNEKNGMIDARYIDWAGSLELNERRFRGESEHFNEDILPFFKQALRRASRPSKALLAPTDIPIEERGKTFMAFIENSI